MQPRFYNSSAPVPKHQTIAPPPSRTIKEIPLQPWKDGKYWHSPQEAREILSQVSVTLSLASIYRTICVVWIEGYHYKRFGPNGGRIGININRVIEH